MLIHHLNCVTACPLGGQLLDGLSGAHLRGRMVCHCLLVETEGHLVLIDTGYGLRDVYRPRSRLGRVLLTLERPRFSEAMTAVRQIERMGFDPHDVRHIVLTSLDFDHAGGLDDFPDATVHLLAAERAAAEAATTRIDRLRYRPAQWRTQAHWKTYEPDGGETWLGLPRVRALEGITEDILLVPLIGHTLGHCGIAVRREDGGWLLLAGDAYFYYAEMSLQNPRCTPGLAAYQTLMEKDHAARVMTQRRLRELIAREGAALTVVCSHDVREFEATARRPAETPPPRVRMTRDGRPIVDPDEPDAARPRVGEGILPPVVRPARHPTSLRPRPRL